MQTSVIWTSGGAVDQDVISSGIAAVAAVGSMGAAIFSYLSIRPAKRVQQSSVYLAMAARYDSEEMRKACNDLLAWRRAHPERFAEVWSERMEAGEADAVVVNTARRIVARHFLNIARLRRIDAIDPQSARLLADCYGLNVFYQIAVPLNLRLASDVRDFRKLTGELRAIRKEYAGGELIASF